MTEDDARTYIHDRWGSEALRRLERFGSLVVAEAERQNLVAAATIPSIWTRHIVDSAQLAPLAPATARTWIDVGTGAGFPGLVIAALVDADVWLVEPRARRAAFLRHAAEALSLTRTSVVAAKIESAGLPPADVVSARAVAPIDTLFRLTRPCTSLSTTFILPRGRSGREEAGTLAARWRGLFHVEQSLTDPDAAILLATKVRPRCSASP